MNHYVESVAILIVTSCILPCLGLVLIVWLIRTLFGVDMISRFKPHPGQERAERERKRTELRP